MEISLNCSSSTVVKITLTALEFPRAARSSLRDHYFTSFNIYFPSSSFTVSGDQPSITAAQAFSSSELIKLSCVPSNEDSLILPTVEV